MSEKADRAAKLLTDTKADRVAALLTNDWSGRIVRGVADADPYRPPGTLGTVLRMHPKHGDDGVMLVRWDTCENEGPYRPSDSVWGQHQTYWASTEDCELVE